MTKVVMHIGLPKTGTTTLQQAVFARHPQIRAFIKQGTKHLIADDVRRFRENVASVQHYLEPRNGDERITVVSDESLSLAEYTPVRQQQWGMHLSSDHETLARRIAAAFDDPLVLIVIREQKQFLESLYSQHLKTEGPGAYPPRGIDRWIETAITNAPHRSLFNLIKYDEMYEAYVASLGRSRVVMLPFEEMVRSLEVFAEKLASALGVDFDDTARLLRGEWHNRRQGSFQPRWLRAVRQRRLLKVGKVLLPSRIRYWTYGKAALKTPRVSPEYCQRVAEFFAPSNRRFEEIAGCRLQDLGYSV